MKSRVKKLIRTFLHLRLPDSLLLKFIYRKLYALCFWGEELFYAVRKIFWVEPIVRSLCSKAGKNLRIERTPYLTGKGALRLGRDMYISGKIGISFNSKLNLSPQLSIGDRTFIGHECGFFAADSITIGNDCLLASGTRIYDNDGHPLDAEKRVKNEPVSPDQVAPVIIGDRVWIGTNSILLKGVTVGDRAIIGAGSVVTHSIPPDVIAAGNPAKVIKQNPPRG